MSQYYVVFVGKQPGIYQTWEECHDQVIGVSGSCFRSFTTFEEAQEAFDRYFEEVGSEVKEGADESEDEDDVEEEANETGDEDDVEEGVEEEESEESDEDDEEGEEEEYEDDDYVCGFASLSLSSDTDYDYDSGDSSS